MEEVTVSLQDSFGSSETPYLNPSSSFSAEDYGLSHRFWNLSVGSSFDLAEGASLFRRNGSRTPSHAGNSPYLLSTSSLFPEGERGLEENEVVGQCGGVQYAGCPHFWLNADGTYPEKVKKGNLWSKPGTKLYGFFLSLTIPSKRACEAEERALRKLLLVGSCGSGTGTICKQVRLLYRKPLPFSEEELENIKVTIQANVYQYLGLLLQGREYFEEEWLLHKGEELSLHQETDLGNDSDTSDQQNIYSISPRLKKLSDWFISVLENGTLEAIFPAATRKYAPIVEELWKSPAIQATYNRRSELLSLPSAASYFLKRIIKISRPEYKPSEMDIILCDGTTSSKALAYTDFSLPHVEHGSTLIDHFEQHESPSRKKKKS